MKLRLAQTLSGEYHHNNGTSYIYSQRKQEVFEAITGKK